MRWSGIERVNSIYEWQLALHNSHKIFLTYIIAGILYKTFFIICCTSAVISVTKYLNSMTFSECSIYKLQALFTIWIKLPSFMLPMWINKILKWTIWIWTISAQEVNVINFYTDNLLWTTEQSQSFLKQQCECRQFWCEQSECKRSQTAWTDRLKYSSSSNCDCSTRSIMCSRLLLMEFCWSRRSVSSWDNLVFRPSSKL